MKTQRNVIVTQKERKKLEDHRSQLRRNGKTVSVKQHERKISRIESPVFRREARWAEVEDSVFRLCSDHERRGRISGDKNRAKQLKEMLNDVFGV